MDAAIAAGPVSSVKQLASEVAAIRQHQVKGGTKDSYSQRFNHWLDYCELTEHDDVYEADAD